MNEKYIRKEFIEGIVTARKCACCGHHEIGIKTQTGEYIPLRPGMQITIIEKT